MHGDGYSAIAKSGFRGQLYKAIQKYLHDEASMLGRAKLASIKEVAKEVPF